MYHGAVDSRVGVVCVSSGLQREGCGYNPNGVYMRGNLPAPPASQSWPHLQGLWNFKQYVPAPTDPTNA
jgi:hypothetical protein